MLHPYEAVQKLNVTPFQGSIHFSELSRGDAPGWYVLPFQGVGINIGRSYNQSPHNQNDINASTSCQIN